MFSRSRNIAFVGLFVAISIILSRFFSYPYLPYLRIGLGDIPLILSGIILGPVYGGICGGLADALGFYLSFSGFPHPGITLSAALTGIIPGVLFPAIQKYRRSKNFSYVSILLVVFVTNFITSTCLNSLWLSQLTGNPFRLVFFTRILAGFIIVPVHAFIVRSILRASGQYLHRL